MATQLEGIKELTGKLTEMGAKLAARELRGTTKAALEEAEHVARARMPQGTEIHKTYRGRVVTPGYALTTLHVETQVLPDKDMVVAKLGVGREAFYVVQFVELGTYKMPARPWLRPAFEASEDAMLRTLSDEMRRRIDKIAKRRAAGKRL